MTVQRTTLFLIMFGMATPGWSDIQPADTVGSWGGLWNNNTFDSEGASFLDVVPGLTPDTMNALLNLNGFVFGGDDPLPLRFNGSIDEQGNFSASVSGSDIGDASLSIGTDEQISSQVTNIPGGFIDSVDLIGTINMTEVRMNYTVNFSGGGGTAVGTLNLDKIVPDTGLVSSTLPASHSVQNGDAATFFATMINTGTATAEDCFIEMLTDLPAGFGYQTTNPLSNALSGSANTPTDIAAGDAQTFVFSITPDAAFASTEVQLDFTCANADPAPQTLGVNTVLLTAANGPVPDIIALVATGGSIPGTVDLDPANGLGAFAVATVNVGVGGNITAMADTGTADLPLTLSLCQTDPGSGACTSAMDNTVSLSIGAGETPTFAIFPAATGEIPFDPALNRIFVRFEDDQGIIRGATSVAVQRAVLLSGGNPPMVTRLQSSANPPFPRESDDSVIVKVTCMSADATSFTQDCPVLQFGDLSVWAYSYTDNRSAFDVVVYDGSGAIVSRIPDVSGARYIADFSIDDITGTITLIGQSSSTATLSYEELGF